MADTKRQNIPPELRDKLSSFDSALTEVENRFTPLLKTSKVEMNAVIQQIIDLLFLRSCCKSKADGDQLSPLDKAKLDLVAAYGINSLFWMYLNACGVNPKDHGIKQELDRIRSYMNRVKELQDKEKAPSVDVQASKRMVKSALWQAAQKGVRVQENAEESAAGPSTEGPQDRKGMKRKSDEHSEQAKKKKKKKKKKKQSID